MKTFIRADFDFKSEKDKINHCTGYVVCYDVEQKEYGCDFKIDRIIIKKLIATNPNFEKIEQPIDLNAKLCYNYTNSILLNDTGKRREYRDGRRVKARRRRVSDV